MLYAGFWKRVGASLIDGVILYAINFVVGFVLALVMDIDLMPVISEDNVIDPGYLSGMLLVNVINIAIVWTYFAVMESSKWKATVGKKALGIVVVNRSYERISFVRAFVRYPAKLISTIILFIGYMMAGFTSKKQALHDMIAGTIVVNKKQL